MNPLILAENLIKHFEGVRLTAYQDSGEVWTLGYGHTKDVVQGMTCTQQQADTWLIEDMAPLIVATQGLPMFKMVAYLDFGFNCGLGALRKLMAGSINLYAYGRRDSTGKDVPGLVARRETELALIALGG